MRNKYMILVGDGMGDYPMPELGGKTPLEVAETPYMDLIASQKIGLVQTIPPGMEPGSDVANLCILGYDPKRYHTGRAPLEAASKGIKLGPKDTAFRMNLVSLEFLPQGRIRMLSHSSGDISSSEAKELVDGLKPLLERDGIRMFLGVAYRHLLIWEDAPPNLPNIPPHDFLGQDVTDFIQDPSSQVLWDLVRSSWEFLRHHPLNKVREFKGALPANSIWLWGQGKAPELMPFHEMWGLDGAVISAVDLVKGIGRQLGLKVVEVPGATGYIDSNFKGKAETAIEALKEVDLVFLHVEAPDEASHGGDLDQKIKAIQIFDTEVVGRIIQGAKDLNPKIMVISDHLTPIVKRTHTSDPTPFAWAQMGSMQEGKKQKFCERAAMASGIFIDKGHELIRDFLESGI